MLHSQIDSKYALSKVNEKKSIYDFWCLKICGFPCHFHHKLLEYFVQPLRLNLIQKYQIEKY